jgi:hemolysin III
LDDAPETLLDPGVTAVTAAEARSKPLLRGVSHSVAAVAMLVVGPLVVTRAHGARDVVLTLVYVLSVEAMFTVSALFHRVTWSPEGRRRMRRLDHSMIFVAIAGSYTATAGMMLPGHDSTLVISIVWVGASAGVILRMAWLDAPKWAVALPYLALGWLALAFLPEMMHAMGGEALGLVGLGGAFYTAGAVVYARKRPDPWPKVFGYHEIFHALVIAGAVTHLCVVAFIVLPSR